MKKSKEIVYAFIDSNNLNLGIEDLGCKIWTSHVQKFTMAVLEIIYIFVFSRRKTADEQKNGLNKNRPNQLTQNPRLSNRF